MKKVDLGSTGLKVFPLVYGSLPLGPLQADLSPAVGGRLIRHAFEAGIDAIDTAHLYGTYAHIRAALDGLSKKPVIISKTHATTGREACDHVHAALSEMGLECLDVVHLHGARLSDPFNERDEVFSELIRLRDQGKISYLGLSTHYIRAVRIAADHPEIDVIHPLINQQGMGIIDGSPEEMAEAIAYAADRGKGIYAMKALAGGNMIAQARRSLDFVRRLPGVHAVAVGMLSEDEIDANIALFSDEFYDVDRWQYLESQQRRLKIMERFCKGCGSCVIACTNDALEVADGRARVREDNCILCGYCAAACPDFIIRVV